ncbi:hypothetical protein B9Z55_013660 [Caenorhabditis nigoni]|uniref:Uncharacterized protein n=2 Tax=Caenorhabditis nigoni TaxID=1611254 RepID=A0A2G5U2R9_9PELO|nr:hypothetical protein B9Z55_013660 [Caenorhabditis nigoni]
MPETQRNAWKLFVLAVCCISFLSIIHPVFIMYVSIDNFDPNIDDKRRIFIYEYMIDALRKNSLPSEGYQKRPETQHIDCGRVLGGDKSYTEKLIGENRIPLIQNNLLNMSCPAIQNRIHPKNRNFIPLKSGGIAFARIVYTDYEFIEKQLEMSWHPQNVFCFTVDKKSPNEFISRMQKLDECMENVIVLPATESYDSSGHNMNIGQKRCMEALLPKAGWNYILFLQNFDVIVKSVYELERIYELLGGVNDIHYCKEVQGRRVPGLRWDPKSMHLFRNESGISDKVLNSPMRVFSGSEQASLSRAAVKWLIEDVDINIAIKQFNKTAYGCDEQLFPSLQLNYEYGMPGHFTDQCPDYDGPKQITRMTQWANGNINNCPSQIVRHGICLIGIEQLEELSKIPHIMVNKMIPTFDYSVIECTAELLYNRTFLGQKDHQLDDQFYEELLHVTYHKHHNDPGYQLNCTTPNTMENYLRIRNISLVPLVRSD